MKWKCHRSIAWRKSWNIGKESRSNIVKGVAVIVHYDNASPLTTVLVNVYP